MDDAGLFAPDQRLELLGGEVIEMAPIGSRHAAAVKRLNRILSQAVGDRVVVGVQDPVRLSDLSEPQPDLTLLRWRPDMYQSAHPGPADVLLLIEVSDTTAPWDRSVKRPLYAAAGIEEMWVVDIGDRIIEVATNPSPDGYRTISAIAPGGTVTPLAFGNLTLAVTDLLA
jgi:Uma2 family endonuclease